LSPERPWREIRCARALWGDAERYLGQAIANYVTLLNPELLVLGAA